MITGVLCTTDVAKANNNLLTEFCNFNKVFSWNKTAGGTNATILNDVSGRRSYLGIGCISINFTGTSQVSFNAGDNSMERTIQRDGNYVLSYAFDKSDPTSDITFIVEMYVNGVLQAANTITQNLYNTSGFIDEQYNRYFQNFSFSYGDVVDFAFKAQSDTTSCYLYVDAFELEIDNKGSGTPCIYAEAPLDVIEEENTLTIGAILDGETVIVDFDLTGATLVDHYVEMKYPTELSDLGLAVGYPNIYSDGVGKFSITNTTGATVTPTADGIYNFKVIR